MVGMPHVIDVEEKQPFIQQHNEEERRDTEQFQSQSHLNTKSQHHVSIGCYGNGEANGGTGGSSTELISSPSRTKQEQLAARNAHSLYSMKLFSALFYAGASFLITVVNKVVLTSYKFPSFQFLALGQLCTTVVVLFLAKQLRIVSYPSLSRDSFKKIFPLPLLFVGNALTGLGGTKTLSLPMFTALRRFSILMTMFAELYILGVHPSLPVQISVYLMVGGAIIASSNDLAFSVEGYTLITLNNIFTAANGVYIKKKLESKEFGKYGLMFYNAFFMVIPLAIFAHFNGEIEKGLQYDGWENPGFLANFSISCFMGFILNASVVMCTQHNSALTTTIIGTLKNISVTYLGMFIGGDYVFHWINFIGINIGVFGSLLYTYVTFKRPSSSGNSK